MRKHFVFVKLLPVIANHVNGFSTRFAGTLSGSRSCSADDDLREFWVIIRCETCDGERIGGYPSVAGELRAISEAERGRG